MESRVMLLVALALAGCVPQDEGEAHSQAESDPQAVAASLYDAFAAGDMKAIGALLGDDVQWLEAENTPLAEGNPYVGFEAVGGGVFGPISETYADFAATPERFTTEGDRVVVEGRYTGTHRESGEPLNAQFVHVYTIEGDTIGAFQQYTDTYQWRRLEGRLAD